MEQVKPTFPSEVIDLPSQGKLYSPDSPLATGKIALKYSTAKEEDILTSKNLIQKGVVIDIFIQSLIVDKSIDANQLLLGDKNAIIVAARILAYGKDYSVQIDCPKCSFRNEKVIDLSNIETKELEYLDSHVQGVNDFSFTLPASKANITFRLLTQADEKAIDLEMKSIKKATLSNVDSEITTRMKYAILSVSGETDRKSIKMFVDSMLSVDSLAFRSELAKITPDVDMKFEFECSDCNHTERMVIPLGVNFFWPSGAV